jgi:hypothetical protein
VNQRPGASVRPIVDLYILRGLGRWSRDINGHTLALSGVVAGPLLFASGCWSVKPAPHSSPRDRFVRKAPMSSDTNHNSSTTSESPAPAPSRRSPMLGTVQRGQQARGDHEFFAIGSHRSHGSSSAARMHAARQKKQSSFMSLHFASLI